MQWTFLIPPGYDFVPGQQEPYWHFVDLVTTLVEERDPYKEAVQTLRDTFSFS